MQSDFSIIDVPGPVTDTELSVAAAELIEHLRGLGPDVRVSQRLLRA